MWSYIQYRRIGKQVEEDIKRRTHADPNLICPWKQPKNSKNGKANPTCDSSPQSPIPQAKRESRLHLIRPRSRTSNNDCKCSNSDDQVQVQIDDDKDPFAPHNWPLTSRCKNIAILTFLIFAQAWAGGSESIGNSEISAEFHISPVTENFATAMYLFGVGSGSLFAGPIAETVGRNPTYLAGTFFYMIFVLGSAVTHAFAGQVVCRFFVGLFASATLAINGSSVGDQFRQVKRSLVFPVIAWANVAARMIAPVAGGWIVANPKLGWRWTEWITLIISAAAFLIAFLFLPETHLPTLLQWKAEHLQRVTGHQKYISEREEITSLLRRMKKILPMPITFFSSEPVIAVLGSYLVLLYILQFSFLSGFDYLFKQTYHLSTGLTGACFGSIAAGSTAFTFSAPGLYIWARHRTAYVHSSRLAPEFRLWPAIVCGPLLPISLLWLGWTNYSSISIWSGLSACFLFGVILTAIYVSTYEYIIDSYGEHAAVALASITMAKYLISGALVMAARPMYEGLGVHWTMTLLGCISGLLVPAPILFWKYGSRLREKSPYAVGDQD